MLANLISNVVKGALAPAASLALLIPGAATAPIVGLPSQIAKLGAGGASIAAHMTEDVASKSGKALLRAIANDVIAVGAKGSVLGLKGANLDGVIYGQQVGGGGGGPTGDGGAAAQQAQNTAASQASMNAALNAQRAASS